MDKKITLIVKGKEEIVFNVTQQSYNRWLNEFQPTNKCAPSIRFLKDCVLPESEPILKKYIDTCFMQLTSSVINEYTTEIEIEIKK